MASKADLINSIVAQSHGLPDALNGSVSESLLRTCEVCNPYTCLLPLSDTLDQLRARISFMSTTCKRFAAVMRRCDVELFLNIGRIYTEVAHFERRIDLHIDTLSRDEFRDNECLSDVEKYV